MADRNAETAQENWLWVAKCAPNASYAATDGCSAMVFSNAAGPWQCGFFCAATVSGRKRSDAHRRGPERKAALLAKSPRRADANDLEPNGGRCFKALAGKA